MVSGKPAQPARINTDTATIAHIEVIVHLFRTIAYISRDDGVISIIQPYRADTSPILSRAIVYLLSQDSIAYGLYLTCCIVFENFKKGFRYLRIVITLFGVFPQFVDGKADIP